jgi:hypothetical protein
MKQFILSGLLGAALCIGTVSAADIVVHLKPPSLKVEHRPARPGPNYIWVGGYHRWDGTLTCGNPANGKFRRASMLFGSLHVGNIAATATFLSRAIGNSARCIFAVE